jgi:probable rRNA maturation factor
MPVFINNIQEKVQVTNQMEELIKQAVAVALKLEEFEEDAEVSISLVDNDYIQELNREYRQKDCPTDVLSFPLLDDEEDFPEVIFDEEDEEEIDDQSEEDDEIEEDEVIEEELLLGDIIISIERAVAQAGDYGHSVEREVAFLTVHGMLHLLGHDHYDEEETKLMRDKEKEAMEIMGTSR